MCDCCRRSSRRHRRARFGRAACKLSSACSPAAPQLCALSPPLYQESPSRSLFSRRPEAVARISAALVRSSACARLKTRPKRPRRCQDQQQLPLAQPLVAQSSGKQLLAIATHRVSTHFPQPFPAAQGRQSPRRSHKCSRTLTHPPPSASASWTTVSLSPVRAQCASHAAPSAVPADRSIGSPIHRICRPRVCCCRAAHRPLLRLPPLSRCKPHIVP